jgi:hypothetical protein
LIAILLAPNLKRHALRFENGKILGYFAPLPGSVFYVKSGNASCPNWPAPAPGKGNYQLERCRQVFSTTTDPITGKATGPPDYVDWYDPRLRPWYTEIVDKGGAHWSEIYVFVSEGSSTAASSGITASREILTANGDFLGVFGKACRI